MVSNFNSLRNRKKTGKTIFFRIFLMAVILIACSIVARTLYRGASAITQISTETVSYAVDMATPKKKLIAKIHALYEQQQMLQSQVSAMQLIEDENNSLRTIMNYPKIERTAIVARVIAKPSQNLYDRIIIDRGTNDGVTIGDRIIADENGLIAIIDQATETTAQGTLISGSFWKGDATLARLGITVPVHGKGSGNFELHVPRDLDVRDGDVMTLPGVPDLIFGIIKTIQFDDRDPYQTVLARTPVNVQELKFVRVIK